MRFAPRLATEFELELQPLVESELPKKLSTVPGFTEAESKAIWLTNWLETGGYGVLGFSKLTGDFDQMGISFGIQQWNFGAGSLQPLLKAFAQRAPDRFAAVFGDGAQTLRSVLAKSKEESTRWAKSLDQGGKTIVEPWRSRFAAAGREPEMQRIQLEQIRDRMNKAWEYVREFGITTERGLAFMYDNVVAHGKWWAAVKNRRALIKQRTGAFARPLTELEKMLVISDVLADTASERWRERVRNRKKTIATGSGLIRGEQIDLAKKFGITETSLNAGAGSVSSTPSSKGGVNLPDLIRLPVDQLAVWQEIGKGNRDENVLTNKLFFSRHPERSGAKIQAHERDLAAEWLDLRNRVVRPLLAKSGSTPAPSATPSPVSPSDLSPWVQKPAEIMLVTTQISAGNLDENDLINRIFYQRHPKRNGTKLEQHDKQLIMEWLSIREGIVRPLLAKATSAAGSHTPGGIAGEWDGARIAPGADESRPGRPTHPPVRSTVSNRSAALYDQVLNQFAVGVNPRYAHRRNKETGKIATYCNIFVWDVTCAMGAEVPHWIDGSGNPAPPRKPAHELNANALYDWLHQHGPRFAWKKVTLEQGHALANQGHPVVATYKKPGGIGHISMIRPGDLHPKAGPWTAQAGAKNSNLIRLFKAAGQVDGVYGRGAAVVIFAHD